MSTWLRKKAPFLIFIVLSVSALWARNWFFTTTVEPTKVHQASGSAALQGNSITLHYHERPPYYYAIFDEVRGLCADNAAKVFIEAGLPFRWRLTPARRQLEVIKADLGRDCAVGWFKTPEREKFGKYTESIYQDSPFQALTRSDNAWLKSGGLVEDALANPHLTLLRKDTYSYGEQLDRLLVELKPRQVLTTAENLSMLQMIHSRRADYFFICPEEADALLFSSGMPMDDFKLVGFSNMMQGAKRYIICSEQVEDGIIEKLNRAIMDLAPGRKGTPAKP